MSTFKIFFKNLFSSTKNKKNELIEEKNIKQSLTDDIELDFEEFEKGNLDDEKHFQAVLLAMQENEITKKLGKAAVKLNFVFAGLLFLFIIYSIFVTWFAVHPVREYFAADNGRIIKMIPLSEPHQKNQAVIQFVNDSLRESFSLDFVNYQKQLEDAREFYTDKGFSIFLEQLKKSGILNTVTEKRMNMYISTSTGVLKQKGINNGRYFWIVQIPVEIKLTGQTTELPPQRLIATVRVERVDVLDSVTGIAISQLVTKPAK